MKVEDIKDGMVVETNNGNRYIRIGNLFLRNGGYLGIEGIEFGDGKYDIYKVFDPYPSNAITTLERLHTPDCIYTRPKKTNFDWLKENIKDMTVKEYLEFVSCKDRLCLEGSCDDCREAWLNSEH